MKKISKFFTMLLIVILIISNNSLVYASNETTDDNEIVSMNVKNDDFQHLDIETCNYVDVIKIIIYIFLCDTGIVFQHQGNYSS